MLWQPIRPFEFTSPVIDVLKYRFLALKPFSTVIFAVLFLRKRFTIRQINERILETPFVLSKITNPKSQILDIGCNESPISLMLASLGHNLTSLDLRSQSFNHINMENIIADITKWRRNNYYDIVVCLSTLEHIGLNVYGSSKIPNGDRLAIDNIFYSLKSGGKLLLTVPASDHYFVTPLWRSYDQKHLKKLLAKFKQVDLKFGIRDSLQNWQVVKKIPADYPIDTNIPSAVALIEAIK